MSSFILHALIALYWKRTCHQGCLLKVQACLTGCGGKKDGELLIGRPEFARPVEETLPSFHKTECQQTGWISLKGYNILLLHI